jgi:hypothetical protein
MSSAGSSLLPLPACGERVGVRGTLDGLGFAESPPHPALRADLSPQAGRGERDSFADSAQHHHTPALLPAEKMVGRRFPVYLDRAGTRVIRAPSALSRSLMRSWPRSIWSALLMVLVPLAQTAASSSPRCLPRHGDSSQRGDETTRLPPVPNSRPGFRSVLNHRCGASAFVAQRSSQRATRTSTRAAKRSCAAASASLASRL